MGPSLSLIEGGSGALAGNNTEALSRIKSLITEIGESVLFRGEAEHFPKIDSTLYRRFKHVLGSKIKPHLIQDQLAHFAVRHFGSELEQYKRDTGEILSWSGGLDPTKFSEDAVRVWSMMQHLGAATNLIDFSADPNVDLFFACTGYLEKNGRVLILVENHDYDLISAKWPANRIKAQRSRFVWSPGVCSCRQSTGSRRTERDEDTGAEVDEKTESPCIAFNDVRGYARARKSKRDV